MKFIKVLYLPILILIFCSQSIANFELQAFDSEDICSKMDVYVVGYRVSFLGARECRNLIKSHLFSAYALNTCRYMKFYAQVDNEIDYGVSDSDINNCFKVIANREYRPSHLIKCQKLGQSEPRFQPNPLDIIRCLNE